MSTKTGVILRLVVVLVSATLLGSCGEAAKPAPLGGVSGTVVVGQLVMPLQRPAAFGMGGLLFPNNPIPHAVVMVRADSGMAAGKVIAELRASDHGDFKKALPPGRYCVWAKGCPQMATPIEVESGQSTSVRVEKIVIP